MCPRKKKRERTAKILHFEMKNRPMDGLSLKTPKVQQLNLYDKDEICYSYCTLNVVLLIEILVGITISMFFFLINDHALLPSTCLLEKKRVAKLQFQICS